MVPAAVVHRVTVAMRDKGGRRKYGAFLGLFVLSVF